MKRCSISLIIRVMQSKPHSNPKGHHEKTINNKCWGGCGENRTLLHWKVKVKSLSRVWLFVTPWTVAHQAPPSMGFSRQEYWSGLTFPSPGDLPNPGIEPRCPSSQADSLSSEPSKPQIKLHHSHALKSCNGFLLPMSYWTSLSVKCGW